VGLRPPRPRAAPGLLGAPEARLTRHAEGLAEQKAFGESGLALTGRLFEAWRSFDEHRRRRLRREIKPIQAELRELCERAGRKSKRTRLHRVFANNLLKIWPALWTLATVDGVEPTNNAADRSLRGPVIHRKLSHGTRTDDGERLSSGPCPRPSPAASRVARCSPT
jgi:transposase